MTVYEKLVKVQAALKAPKNQYNKFGGYSYRNCEDILEAAKPLCLENGCVIYLSDDIFTEAGRVYVKATARFCDVESSDSVLSTAYAREEESKKGMDGSQVTGSASSYARKYALNGLLCIDDTKDSDFAAEPKKEDGKPRPQGDDAPFDTTAPLMATVEQISAIEARYKDRLGQLMQHRGIQALNVLTSAQADEIIRRYDEHMKAAKQ